MRSTEALVGRILFWGGLVSIVVMLAGTMAYVIRGSAGENVVGFTELLRYERQQRAAETGTPPEQPTLSFRAIGRGLTHWPVEPLSVAAAGIVLLLGTPIAGVALAIPSLWLAGDRRYAVIAAIVLTALLLSLTLRAGA